MPKTREELIDWVQARIDEVSETDQDAVIPKQVIEDELDESALQLLRKAPKPLVYPAGYDYSGLKSIGVARVSGGTQYNHSLIIPLPSDFIRFLRIRALEWGRSLDSLATVDSPEYRQQANPYQLATVRRPVAALIPFMLTYEVDSVPVNYSHAIEIFPSPTVFVTEPATSNYRHTADTDDETAFAAAITDLDANYKPVFAPTGAESRVFREFVGVKKLVAEEMPETLVDPMIWLCAARCLTNIRMADLARVANQNYEFAINQLLIGLQGEEAPPVEKG